MNPGVHLTWAVAFVCVRVFASNPASAAQETFDSQQPGESPQGWTCGITGTGKPKWAIEADMTAPSPPRVLKQSGEGEFPWCVKTDAILTDGTVEVRFKAISGRDDAAGGLVWRWKDGDNYYVARANALENNVSLYHTARGHRITIKYVNAPVALGEWHTLRAEFAGSKIAISLDGKKYIDLEDQHIAGPGAVGVWTKADSVTAFDNFSFNGNK